MIFRNTDVRREMTARNKMGVCGITVYDPCDEENQSMYDRKILGFEDESPKAKALADIATRIIEMSDNEEYDVGMVVPVKSSDAADYASMLEDITNAKTIDELCEIAEIYRGLPGALELAKAYALDMGYELSLLA